jgi:hypothetical protein
VAKQSVLEWEAVEEVVMAVVWVEGGVEEAVRAEEGAWAEAEAVVWVEEVVWVGGMEVVWAGGMEVVWAEAVIWAEVVVWVEVVAWAEAVVWAEVMEEDTVVVKEEVREVHTMLGL